MNDNPTYELVHAPSPSRLSEAVSERIERGWWPLGTPFVHGERYIQAMVTDQNADQRAREVARDR